MFQKTTMESLMFCLSPIGGLKSGVAALMMCSAVITLVEPFSKGTSAAVQDEIAAPADERNMEKFMARKLAAAQRTLEGVSRGDYELIRKSSAEMSDLSRHEVWERMASASRIRPILSRPPSSWIGWQKLKIPRVYRWDSCGSP
jgi:hypothetical protein